jgi:tetratricopeptide (TPR) repeat protein
MILALVVFVALAGLLGGCDDTSTGATGTSTAATDTSVGATGTTTAGVPESVVVGGSEPEEYEAALPDLEKAVEAAPDDIKALDALVIAQFQTGRYEEAAATYEKMLQIKDDAFTHNNYGNVLRKLGRIDEAKAQYQQAIATDPTLAFAYANLSYILVDEGDEQGALEVLQSGLEKVTGEDKESLQTIVDRLTSTTTTT